MPLERSRGGKGFGTFPNNILFSAEVVMLNQFFSQVSLYIILLLIAFLGNSSRHNPVSLKMATKIPYLVGIPILLFIRRFLYRKLKQQKLQ